MVTKNKIPPAPEGIGGINLSDNSLRVMTLRYLRKDDSGQTIETPDEMLWRVAYSVASVESNWNGDVQTIAEEYYRILSSKLLLPNTPTFTGAGTPLGQLAACFVLPISDEMGRTPSGIFQTLRNASLIQQSGGGNGFSFSRLRPSGAIVKSSAGKATGPVGFLRVYDRASSEIAQGGTRRGANMAVLRVDHPDILEFISCKRSEDAITNFNISVGITDEFMKAVETGGWWDLRFPDVTVPEYREFDGTINDAKEQGIPIKVYKQIKAREIWDKIVKHAHMNGEPGVLFLSTMNRTNPINHRYEIEATNPCGEQPLGPYESCCLGSINLAEHIAGSGEIDWKKLEETVKICVRFLDDVVDANQFVNGVPQVEQAARNARRIGLGILGLADVMYRSNVRYGEDDSLVIASRIMEFIRYHAMMASIDLAKSRGSFPEIKGSVFDPNDFRWQPPEAIDEAVEAGFAPAVDWKKVVNSVKKHGIRNAAILTIAPTGTTSTIAGCEGYGCEPVFALVYQRNVVVDGRNEVLEYTSPLFENALRSAGRGNEEIEAIADQVRESGSCQSVEGVPGGIKEVFVVSQDIKAEEHVLMQAALQAFVDSSISKTVNLPQSATVQDVEKIYRMAWRLGCKGVTVYVSGSRKNVVLETKSSQEKDKDSGDDEEVAVLKKQRPGVLGGRTYKRSTPVGEAFVTINHNGEGNPFEVFINTSKSGSDVAAFSEALGRMISYILRMVSTTDPKSRLQEVYRQLWGIGGARSEGFGPNRVRSFPDAIAKVFEEHLDAISGNPLPVIDEDREMPAKEIRLHEQHFELDICPECGSASVVPDGHCLLCLDCLWTQC